MLESYDYLGVGTVARRGHPQPGVDVTYLKPIGAPNGDAGDQYTGLDRFGRVVDHRWVQTVTGTHTDRFHYGYDRVGNRLYRDNMVNAAFGEVYTYDGLNQLASFARGTLNGTKTGLTGAPARSQAWDYDAVGNWERVTTSGSDQTRGHNRQNEITSLDGGPPTGLPLALATSLGGNASLHVPAFDSAGNTTREGVGQYLVYDGWNRLVAVQNTVGLTIVTFSYDGFNRRVRSTASGSATNLYYSSGWQVLEEQVESSTTQRYVWSPVYVDTLVLRDRDTDADGVPDDERLWVAQDANRSITTVVDHNGAVVERYSYDPFGHATVLDANWASDGDGQSDVGWAYYHQGLRYDAAAGLHDNRYRWYSSTLGRFVSLDPIRFGAGDVNFYRYVGNNPTVILDPSGLNPTGVSPGQAAGLGVAAGVGAFFAEGIAAAGAVAGPAAVVAAPVVAGGAAATAAGTAGAIFGPPIASAHRMDMMTPDQLEAQDRAMMDWYRRCSSSPKPFVPRPIVMRRPHAQPGSFAYEKRQAIDRAMINSNMPGAIPPNSEEYDQRNACIQRCNDRVTGCLGTRMNDPQPIGLGDRLLRPRCALCHDWCLQNCNQRYFIGDPWPEVILTWAGRWVSCRFWLDRWQ